MSDYETTQRRRNTIVGIFVFVAVASLVWLIYKFGDLPTKISQISSFEIFVQFPSAPGVQKDTPVRFCGYQIGRVTAVMPPEPRYEIQNGNQTNRKYHQTVVVISINKKYVNIPINSQVKLMTRGLGSSYIEIKAPIPDPNEPVTKFFADKSLVQGSTGVTSEFFPEESQQKLDELVKGLVKLIDNANEVIGDQQNKDNIKKTLANLSSASEQATVTLKEFQKFSTTAIVMSEELTKTVTKLHVILEKINSGQGTAAKLVNDGKLYEDLLENMQQLQLLLQDIKSFVAEFRAKGIKVKL